MHTLNNNTLLIRMKHFPFGQTDVGDNKVISEAIGLNIKPMHVNR